MEEIIFPNQIRMYRRVRGRSMQELADFLGVSLSAVSKIEKGYRRIDQEQLVRIAEFLDCPLQEIFVNEASSQPDVVQAWRREQERRNRVNERSGLKMLGAGLRYIRGQKNLTLSDIADGAEFCRRRGRNGGVRRDRPLSGRRCSALLNVVDDCVDLIL